MQKYANKNMFIYENKAYGAGEDYSYGDYGYLCRMIALAWYSKGKYV